MQKKLLCTFFLFFAFSVLLLCIPGHTYAASDESSIKVVLDEDELVFDVPPVMVDGRVLVPMRVIFEALGADIAWNSATNTATCTKGSIKVVLQIDNNAPTVNGKPIKLDVPATLIDNRTMVPTRFIAESLGATVEWDENDNRVIITSTTSVTFADKNLEAAVREEIKKTAGNLSLSDVKQVYSLDASDKSITSLDGIQYLKNLKTLNLGNNQINDITPLQGMKALQYLYLDSNRIRDITPLRSLTELKFLNLTYNQIVDLTPLSSLQKLEYLELIYNQYNDITALKDLKNLFSLNIYGNSLLDLTPLKGLNKLSKLYLQEPSKPIQPEEIPYETYNQMNLKAKEIINTVITPGMSDVEKELALHDYIVTHVKYDKENVDKKDVPWESHTIYGALIKGTAVCDGYANTMKALLHLAGIESYVVVGDSLDDQDNTVGHAWNIVKIGGEYYHLDATWDDPTAGNSTSRLYHTYFNLSDRQVLATHFFDLDAYPKCKKDSSVYYRNTDETKSVLITDDYAYTPTKYGILEVDLKKGTNTKLCSDVAYDLNYWNGWIYYINSSDNDKIYKIKPDGTGRSEFNGDKTFRLSVHNGKLYYIYANNIDDLHSKGLRILSINPDNTGRNMINLEELTTYFTIVDDWIFYKAFAWGKGGRMYKIDIAGGGATQLSPDVPPGFQQSGNSVSFYYGLSYECILNNWVYYINTMDGNKLYRFHALDLKREKLSDDSIANLELYGDWVYYRNTDDNKHYRIKLDGTGRTCVE